MNRGGPDVPASKIIPDGEKNCLNSLTFVISDVLQSLERDECNTLIEKYGGRVTTTISGKTNYLIIGRDLSETKMNKAREMNIKIISKDDLLELIRTRPEVDKYKPTTIKHLIEQQAKSSFRFNRNEDPSMFKPALLSGPSGIGKTTTAQLVYM
ncbi:unnamed protein product, partial [Rotaria sordida]